MEPSLLPIDILEAQQDFPKALAACKDLDGLMRLKGVYIGREGSHAAVLMELLKAAPKEQKRELGGAINVLKNAWEEALRARQAELEAAKRRLASLGNTWDPDLPPLSRTFSARRLWKVQRSRRRPITSMASTSRRITLRVGVPTRSTSRSTPNCCCAPTRARSRCAPCFASLHTSRRRVASASWRPGR